MTPPAPVTPHPLAHPPYITTLALSCSIFPPKHSINFPDIYHISSSTLSCYSPVAPIIRCWVSSHFTWCSLNISSIIHLKYIPVPSLAPYHHHDRHCSPTLFNSTASAAALTLLLCTAHVLCSAIREIPPFLYFPDQANSYLHRSQDSDNHAGLHEAPYLHRLY